MRLFFWFALWCVTVAGALVACDVKVTTQGGTASTPPAREASGATVGQKLDRAIDRTSKELAAAAAKTEEKLHEGAEKLRGDKPGGLAPRDGDARAAQR